MRQLTLGFAYVWLALSVACGTSKDDAASASGPSDGESTASHASSGPVDSVVADQTKPTPAAEAGANAPEPSVAMEAPHDAGDPAAYNCVAAAAHEQCSRLLNSASTFCCPEAFDFPEEVRLG